MEYTYFKCQWLHEPNEFPVWIYSEIDPGRWEKRKVEVFIDSTMAPASGDFDCGDTRLGIVPVPSLKDIASDPEFEPSEIAAKEFEEVWEEAIGNPRLPLVEPS
ncbi:MAG TPA: hypothetical protein VG944_07570 [Fimbriimonas sp.]|nr:hypothetical protein [Fimbriimonas sp.]